MKKRFHIKPIISTHSPQERLKEAEKNMKNLYEAYLEAKETFESLQSQSQQGSINPRNSRKSSIQNKLIMPVQTDLTYNQKETLAYIVFGRDFSSWIISLFQSRTYAFLVSISYILMIISFLSSIDTLPLQLASLSIVVVPFILLNFFILNKVVFIRLLSSFETWYLIVYALGMIMCSAALFGDDPRGYYTIVGGIAFIFNFTFIDARVLRQKGIVLLSCGGNIIAMGMALCSFYFNWIHVEDIQYQFGSSLSLSLRSVIMNCMTTLLIFTFRSFISAYMYPQYLIILKSRLRMSSDLSHGI